jgi:hypothetical protein
MRAHCGGARPRVRGRRGGLSPLAAWRGVALLSIYVASFVLGCGKPVDPGKGPVARADVSEASVVAIHAPDTTADGPDGERAGADDATAPSPYDLAADVAARTEEARTLLGERAAVTVVQAVFVIVSPRAGAQHAAAVNLARQALDAWFHGRFSRRPEHALGVFVFPNHASYAAFCARRFGDAGSAAVDLLGFYDDVDHLVVVNAEAGLTTLTHEIAHPLVTADFPARPAWFNEGLGSLFETPVFPRPGEIHGASNWRHGQLVEALRSPSERARAGLERLFGMNDDEFRGHDLYLHYAMARELCRWLDERGQLWAFYAAWRDGVDADPTGQKAFERVVGMTPADASGPWAKWVLAQ